MKDLIYPVSRPVSRKSRPEKPFRTAYMTVGCVPVDSLEVNTWLYKHRVIIREYAIGRRSVSDPVLFHHVLPLFGLSMHSYGPEWRMHGAVKRLVDKKVSRILRAVYKSSRCYISNPTKTPITSFLDSC